MKSLFCSLVAILSFAVTTFAADPASTTAGSEEGRGFWSFQPVRKPPLPAVKNDAWAKTPIDRFILAKLEEKGLNPVAPADRLTLIRRVTFDLTGLPPTPEEIETFVKKSQTNPRGAYKTLVDRLLASPQYGEAQARHWLDVARYAEDQAHTFGVRPNSSAYRYRDWVVDAFNSDLPYNRFVKLQIAADLMDDGSPEMLKHKAALGFFGLGAQYYKNTDAAKAAADELDDRVDTLTRGFLGLTVSCARCHDHKFDPIPTQDYYSIAGIFWSSKLADVSMASKQEQDRYQEGQKKVAVADKKVKDLIQVERDKIIATRIDQLPAYFLAAWKVEAMRMSKPDFSPAALAKKDKLDAGAIDRMARFLSKKIPNTPVVDSYQRVLPKKDGAAEPTPEVLKAAEEFGATVRSSLGKPNDKAKADMVQAVFGEKGVLPIGDSEVVSKMTAECKQQLETMKKEHAAVVKSAPSMPPSAHGLAEASPIDLKVYIRGNPAKQGDLAPRRFLRVVAGENRPAFKNGSGRLELAEAVADPKNPLTARVFVNRLWQQHFNRGIVGTPSNFGALGERPTHPELLDYLASRFVESGWSVKQIHREILLSATYQLSSENSPAATPIDPDNRLLWRMSRQRLRVEEFRDALLSVSGRLDRTMGGSTTNLDDAENVRRTLYAKISRHELNGFLRLFDFPDANITADRRSETTVPQQQLFVLNSPFMVNQAKALAARLQRDATDDGSRVRRAYLLAYGRPASDEEVQIGLGYVGGKDSAEEAARNKLTRWERLAQALLASNEFMYID